MGVKLGSADRSKSVVDEVSRMFFSGDYFGVTWVANLEGAGTGEGDLMNSSELTMVGNKLGINYGEVLGITLGVV